MRFAGKRILVSGGALGLGKSVVEKFYEAGAFVGALDKNEEALIQLKSELPKLTTVHLDLTNWKAVEIEMGKLDPLDILVNNAGVLDFTPALDITKEHVDFMFSVNFKAGLNLSKLFAKQVVANGIKGASIVNTSSIICNKAQPGALVYCCSKAAVTVMTKTLAVVFGPLGIRVNAIGPTSMRTDLFNGVNHKDALLEKLKKMALVSPIPRTLETTDAVDLILFLASSTASMITGEAVAIDGEISLI